MFDSEMRKLGRLLLDHAEEQERREGDDGE